MQAINLDFVQSPRKRRSGGLALFALGAIAALTMTAWRADLQGKTRALETQAVRLERETRGLGPAGSRLDESVSQEIQRANEVIDQLALPWDRLFRAVESVPAGQVTLLGIAPEAKSGTVQISAEAADADSMFAYVSQLQQQSELTNVYLLEHERDKRGGPRPLHFVVTASWLQPPAKR
jgi:Tfp pilus assembly protein PilN